MKKFLIFVVTIIVIHNFSMYAQPQYPQCYNNDASCQSWSSWECRSDLWLKLDGIDYIPLSDCQFQVSACWRYCLSDPSNFQINLLSTGPRNDECVQAFWDYINMPGKNRDQQMRNIWEDTYKSLAKWVLQNKGLQYGNYDCDAMPPRIFREKKYSPGNCTMICVFNDENGKPKFQQTPCIQDFCCGILYLMCWDTSVNPPEAKIIDEIKISEGAEECLISPEPPLQLCPPGTFDGTRCFSDCLY